MRSVSGQGSGDKISDRQVLREVRSVSGQGSREKKRVREVKGSKRKDEAERF